MIENPWKLPGPVRRSHRLAVTITGLIARLLLVAAGFTLLALLLLLVMWWRVLSWPHRRATRSERDQLLRQALLELLHAAGGLHALWRSRSPAA